MKRLTVIAYPVLLALGCSDPGSSETDTDASTGALTTGTSEPDPGTTGTPTSTTNEPTSTTDEPTSTTPTSTTDETTDTGGEGCEPGAQEYCYTGAFASDGVGICVAGLTTCLPDGSAFGPCEGEITPQLEDCDSPEDENCDGLSGCPTGTELWSHHYGDEDRQWAAAVATGKDDSIVMTGIFEGVIDLGGGPLTSTGSWDVYIAKFDGAGAHAWSKQLGGSYGGQISEAVCVDGTGAVYVSGSFAPDIDLGGGVVDGAFDTHSGFIAKYAPDGAYVWGKTFTPSNDQGYFSWLHMACDPAGGVAVAGHTNSDIDLGGGLLPGGGGMDLIVARFDAQGDHAWSQRYGDAMDQFMGGVALAPNGDVVFCGELNGSADFGGGAHSSNGESDIFVARLDGAGAHVWSVAHGGDSFEQCTVLAVDPQGSTLLAGSYLGNLDLGGGNLSGDAGDLFLAKLDSSGAHVWSRGFGAAFMSSADVLAVDDSANVYLYGAYDSSFGTFDIGVVLPMTEGNTTFAAKYSSTGDPLWGRAYGGAGATYAGGLAVDSAGDLVMSGRFDDDIDFGNGPHLTAGSDDLFLAKIRIE